MICYMSRGARFGEVWFGEHAPAGARIDVLVHRQVTEPVPNSHVRPFMSLVTDLTAPADTIFGEFGKNCRQKVSRADRRDGLQLEFTTQPESRLVEFRNFYDEFASQKQLRRADHRWLAGAMQADQLALACVRRDGEQLVWHGYVVTRDFAWLQYSASSVREPDNAHRSLVGRANRWLHWQCMLKFREMGIRAYDWGGYFDDESTAERAGINRFKREYRGCKVRRFDCVQAATTRGRLRLYLHLFAERGRAMRERSAGLADRGKWPRGIRLLLGR